MDDTPSSSLHLNYNELGEDIQEDQYSPACLLLHPDVLTPHSVASHPEQLSMQLTPDDQSFHLPQIYFDIFIPPQILS